MHQIIKYFNLNRFLNLIIVLSFIYSFFYNLVFFELASSPDYDYYFSYIETFFRISNFTNLDQGLIYHFLVSLILSFSENSLNAQNLEIYISNSIHLVNNILFVISMIGLNYLLKFYNLRNSDRKLIIILTIFLPFLTVARFHYKPEIFAIAFTPWMLLNFLRYFKNRNILNLLFGTTLFIGIVFLKGNIFVMLSLVLFLAFLSKLKTIQFSHFIAGLVYFFIVSIPIIYENYRFNNLFLFKNTQKRYTSQIYENTVTFDFFTEFSFNKYIRKPNFDPENINFFSIIFGDTFNDFYGVSWNIDHFSMKREFFPFENWILNGLLNYSEYYITFVLSILFYFLIISKSFNLKSKEEKVFYLAPFIGILILILNSTGIPFKNFDPNKGDTFKSIYYSFLLYICVIYLTKNIFPNLKNSSKIFILSFFIFLNLFSMGINTEIFKNEKYVQQRTTVLESSPVCKIGATFDFGLFDVNCNPPSDSCGKPEIENNYTKKEFDINGNPVFYIDDKFKEIYLFNNLNLEYIVVEGFDQCYHYLELGYTHPFKLKFLRFPFFNILIFISMIASIMVNIFKKI